MIKLFKHYISLRRIIFILGEGLLIYAAVTLASFFLLEHGSGIEDLLEIIWRKVLLVALVTQVSLYFNDLYEIKMSDSVLDLATRLVQSIGITSITLAVIYSLFPNAIIGRWIFFFSIIFLLLFLVSWRLIYAVVIRKKLFSEKAILLGSGALARDILSEMRGNKDISYEIIMAVGHERENSPSIEMDGVSFKHGFDSLCELAEKEEISNIIVALDEKRGVFPVKELLSCKTNGISIIDGVSFYERITGKLLVDKINPSWLIFSDGFVKSRTSRIMKTTVGLILSVCMLIILSPIILLTALAIKLDSPGPVLFAQDRVGEFGAIFTLYKFRSMKKHAEKETGPVWATEDDPRVTRVGRIIRKVRLDELPQLWNIFKGDLSFVGPRPERPFFVEQLKKKIPYYKERFSVKPGLTGWAQIKYPYGASEEDALEKLKYDLFYIKNMSLVMDLIIMFHTVKTVLLRRGSR